MRASPEDTAPEKRHRRRAAPASQPQHLAL